VCVYTYTGTTGKLERGYCYRTTCIHVDVCVCVLCVCKYIYIYRYYLLPDNLNLDTLLVEDAPKHKMGKVIIIYLGLVSAS
jgi:hypothetical protein